MPQDYAFLMLLVQIFVILAAFFTTAFPLLYLLFPWRSTLLGKLLMLQGTAFALAIDGTAVFMFWTPKSMTLLLWLNVAVFGLIACSTAALTIMLCRTNRVRERIRNIFKRRGDKYVRDERGVRGEAPSSGDHQLEASSQQ